MIVQEPITFILLQTSLKTAKLILLELFSSELQKYQQFLSLCPS